MISIEKKSFLQIPTEEEGRRGIPFVSISFVSPLEEDKGEGITGWSSSRYIDYSRIDLSPWTTDREKVFGGYASIRSEGGREGGGKRREDASHTRVERKKGGKERDDRHREGVSRSTNLSRIEWDRWGRY